MALALLACAWLAGVAYAALAGSGASLPASSIGAGAVAVALLARSPCVAVLGFVCAALFWGGAWRYDATAARAPDADLARLNDGRAVSVRGVVIDEAAVRKGAQRFRIEVTHVRGAAGWRASSGRALVRVPPYPRFAYGDVVEATGEVKTPPVLETFDYRAYLQRQGVVSVMDFPRVRRVRAGEGDPVVRAFVRWRDALGRGIERTLPEPEASLAQGLLLGRRSGLSGFGPWQAGVALAVVAAGGWWLAARTTPGATGEGPGLGLLAWRVARSAFVPSPALWTTGAVALAALALGVAIARADGPPTLTLTALDVGQGDALFIRTPSGAQALIDGGPDGAVLAELGRILGPGDRTIDLVALTHPQEDHVTGLIETLARHRVGTIILGPGMSDTGAAQAWLRAVRAEGGAVHALVAPTSVTLGDVRLDVLWPPPDVDDQNLNAASLVVRVRYGDVTMLLTGDIEADTEAALVASGFDLRADVLKVAHHGSRTSTTQPFLDAVRPSVAVISAGEGNRFGHPAPEVVERLRASGARVYPTDQDGRVTVATDGERLWAR